jgi:hypothetical protein
MFESTLPVGAPDLMRVSAFQRYLDDPGRSERTTRLSSLGATLAQDLRRFDRSEWDALEPLDVLAAALRHRHDLRLHLQCDARVMPMTILPARRQALCPLTIDQFLALRLCHLNVLHVEAAEPVAASDPELATAMPLGLVAWELSLRGSREELLPEIAGPAAYRIAPGTEIDALRLTGSLAAATARLRRATSSLREIAGWPGFDRERATRLLNGLYLQAALIVSRIHPAAAQDGWFHSR